jgi:hypothetical protein
MKVQLDDNFFTAQRVNWRKQGRFACRHGVMFVRPQCNNCPCMSSEPTSTSTWLAARPTHGSYGSQLEGARSGTLQRSSISTIGHSPRRPQAIKLRMRRASYERLRSS